LLFHGDISYGRENVDLVHFGLVHFGFVRRHPMQQVSQPPCQVRKKSCKSLFFNKLKETPAVPAAHAIQKTPLQVTLYVTPPAEMRQA
jgi:hypothetical protein